MPLKIYLAGPDVFLHPASRVAKRKKELCRKYGFEGLFPGDVEVDGAAEIFRVNRRLMDQADVGLFNLTPFRGPSADAGTVFELGYMTARQKPAFGYTAADAPYRDRVAAYSGPLARRGDAGGLERLEDRDGFAVEEFGLSDNLMIVRAIRESGGRLVALPEEAPGRKAGAESIDALAALTAFESCLELLAKSEGA